MSFRAVELFCDVARCGSFSRAAETNGISQSSVSQSVALIEKRLGIELFDRRQRPLRLTALGQRYFEGCRELLDGFHRLEDQIQELARKVTGRLRVATIYSVGLLQMDRYVHAYEQRFPDVDLCVEYLHPQDVYSRVQSEAADLGLVSFPRDTGEFAAIPWQEEPFVLVVSPDHRLARMQDGDYPSAPISELQGEDFVNFTVEVPVRKQLDRWLREAQVVPHTVHEFDNIEQIRRAVEDGVGVALLPAPTVARSIRTGTLVGLQLADVQWFRPLGIIHKRHRALTSAADRFIELLHEDLDSLNKPDGSSEQVRRGGKRGAGTRGRSADATTRSR